MSNDIPTRSRELVRKREQLRCLRCGAGVQCQWAHRRPRGVPGPHQHCPCNGTYLCLTCHGWATVQPRGALLEGYAVSRYLGEPGLVPVFSRHGLILLNCEGGWTLLNGAESEVLVEQHPTAAPAR